MNFFSFWKSFSWKCLSAIRRSKVTALWRCHRPERNLWEFGNFWTGISCPITWELSSTVGSCSKSLDILDCIEIYDLLFGNSLASVMLIVATVGCNCWNCIQTLHFGHIILYIWPWVWPFWPLSWFLTLCVYSSYCLIFIWYDFRNWKP